MSMNVIPVNTFAISFVIPIARRQGQAPYHSWFVQLLFGRDTRHPDRAGISPAVAGHGCHSAGRDRGTQNALHDGIADSRPAADVGTKVFRKGKSRLIGSSTAPRRKISHEKEAADKAQNTLILQPDNAMRSIRINWSIR